MSQKKQLKIGLLGAGTVGAGVFETLMGSKTDFLIKTGQDYKVEAVCVKEVNKKRDLDFRDILLTDNPADIVDNPLIDVVIELIGGIEPARTLLIKAIKNGKHVVTANKALIAAFGPELFNKAKEYETLIFFEASVAGAIPIIKLMRESFLANNIERVEGIINGTTNFVLSEMEQKGSTVEKAVLEAQKKGFAEADPAADITGLDAVNKIRILAFLAFGAVIEPDEIYCEGIQKIELQDILLAKQLGFKIKHLAIASKCNRTVNLRVHPALLPENHPLAKINNEMNAVLTYGELFDKLLCSGPGAGSLPTTSAVLGDLLEIFRSYDLHSDKNKIQVASRNIFFEDQSIIVDLGLPRAQYYLRITAQDQTGTLAMITKTLASCGVSVESIIQRSEGNDSQYVPIAIVTSITSQSEIDEVCRKLSNKNGILGKVIKYRVENHHKGKV